MNRWVISQRTARQKPRAGLPPSSKRRFFLGLFLGLEEGGSPARRHIAFAMGVLFLAAILCPPVRAQDAPPEVTPMEKVAPIEEVAPLKEKKLEEKIAEKPLEIAPAKPIEKPLPGLVVLGTVFPIKDKSWREGLVGLGVHQWIAQALGQSGRFRMLEEKPEVLRALAPRLESEFDKPQTVSWRENADALGADFVAVGRVTNFFARPTGVSFGPFHNARRDTLIKVEISLFDVASGKVQIVQGSGKVGRSKSAFGADFGGKPLPFDASTVGEATGGAVWDATTQLLPGWKPSRQNFVAGSPSPGAPTSLPKPQIFASLPLALSSQVSAQFPVLKSRRVALGIASRVARVIGDTPHCSLQEINPEVLEATGLQRFVAATGAPPEQEIRAQFGQNTDWVIYGEIFSFAVSDDESVSGLGSKVSKRVTLGVQLRALDPKNPERGILLASGMGRALGDWEKWNGEDAEMEQTFVGKAASAAIGSAWPLLLRQIALSQK